MRHAPSSLRIGVVGGTRIPGNVETFLNNVTALLETHSVDFEFDLIARVDATDDFSRFNVIDSGIENTTRALGTLRTLTTAVIRYASNNPVDVLFQVTKFPVHGFATAVAGRLTSTPAITRFAGDNFNEHLFADGIAERIRTFGLNNLIGTVPAILSDATIVLGPHGRAEIKRRNRAGVIREIPQPVDFDQFSPVSEDERTALRDELGMSGDGRVLLTVGRLSERKGMRDVMAAAQKLDSRDVNVRWYVAGDGPLYEPLSETPLVETVGRVAHERMPDYYRAADLVVHPSLIEGLPNVLLEAAACGTPTLSRRVGDAATVASETYEEPDRLPKLVLQEYAPVELGEEFAPESLREAYAEVLMKAQRDQAQ